ncbi:MAG: hypothetical protein K2P17_03670 [Helicobacteraceae bacterium]|nr:hypothetical protein [Helicobacteraceae bacterium]
MKFLIIFFGFLLLEANSINFESNHFQSQKEAFSGAYYTNEAFRAAAFGAKNIARDLFFKACVFGDNLGCRALNEINAPLKTERLFLDKQECDFGDKEACFKIFRYYQSEPTLDSFKMNYYLSKACRLGKSEACKLESKHIQPFLQDKRQLLGNACFKSDAKACYELGNIYLFGKGVVKNVSYAKDMIKKSCDIGLKKACVDYIRIMSFVN